MKLLCLLKLAILSCSWEIDWLGELKKTASCLPRCVMNRCMRVSSRLLVSFFGFLFFGFWMMWDLAANSFFFFSFFKINHFSVSVFFIEYQAAEHCHGEVVGLCLWWVGKHKVEGGGGRYVFLYQDTERGTSVSEWVKNEYFVKRAFMYWDYCFRLIYSMLGQSDAFSPSDSVSRGSDHVQKSCCWAMSSWGISLFAISSRACTLFDRLKLVGEQKSLL